MVLEDLEILVTGPNSNGLAFEVPVIDTMPPETLAANASLAYLRGDFHEAAVLYEAALSTKGLPNPQAAYIFLADTYFQLHNSGEMHLPNEVLKKIREFRIRNGSNWSIESLQDEVKAHRTDESLFFIGSSMHKVLTSTALYFYDSKPNIGKVWSNIDKSGIYQAPTSSELKRSADLMCTAMLLMSPPSSEIFPGLSYLVRSIKGFETNYSPLGPSQS